MKTKIRASLLLVTIAAAGLGIARAAERPEPPRPQAGSYAPALPSGSASAPPEPEPVPVNGKKPWAPVFAASVPETPSDPPTKEEWERAPEAPEVRITEPSCSAKRLREYYRIYCGSAGWIGLISGSREGVTFGCVKHDKEAFACSETWVIFPARRGDSRSFEFFVWSKYGPSPDTFMTEQFLEGDPYPLISVHGLHWGY